MSRIQKKVAKKLRYITRRALGTDCVKLNGITLPTKDVEISAALRQVILSEQYENEESSIIARTLTKEDCVLELGAGLGYLSSLCAKKVGGDNVYTCEANPQLPRLIKRVHALNDVSPHLLNGLVSASPNDVGTFFISENFWSGSALVRSEDLTRKSVEVPIIPLMEILHKAKPSYLICDIEGGEYDLFSFAVLPEFVKKICIELHPHVIGNEKCTFVIRHLVTNGFNLEIDNCNGRVFYFSR